MSGLKRDKIQSIQTLRAIACIGVFSSHCGLSFLGPWGVSIFFMLSGFVMFYRYENTTLEVGFKSMIKFSMRKILKLYPLHIVISIIVLLNTIIADGKEINPIRLTEYFFANILLIKSWIPNSVFYFSLGGTTWFLSTIAFLYFLFPVLLRILQKKMSKIKAVYSILLVVFIEIVVSLVLVALDLPRLGDDTFVRWATYILPVFRVGDFIIGMNVAFLFLQRNGEKEEKNCILLFFAIALTIAVEFMQHYCFVGEGSEWYKYNLIYVPISILLIWVFAVNKGIVRKLSTKIINTVGDLSGEFFLLQNVTIGIVLKNVPRIINNYLDFIYLGVIAFAATFVLAVIWKKMWWCVYERIAK